MKQNNNTTIYIMYMYLYVKYKILCVLYIIIRISRVVLYRGTNGEGINDKRIQYFPKLFFCIILAETFSIQQFCPMYITFLYVAINFKYKYQTYISYS